MEEHSSVFQPRTSKQLKRRLGLKRSAVTSFVSMEIDTRAREERG